MPREREQEPRCRTIQSQAERRDRGQTEKSWRLFEGIVTFLYGLMRKSKIEWMTTEDPVMNTLTARLTSLELQPQIWQSGPTGDANPPGGSLDSPCEGSTTEVNATPPEPMKTYGSPGESPG